MYPIPPTETLVQTKTCRHCQTSFPITDKDLEFYEKVSPVFDGKRYLIPTPTLCPDCRQQRRLSFRNERKLYKRNCDATGKSIISIYSPDKPFKVYYQDYWWSDKWDPMEHWRDFDFGRGFFEQFGELMGEVPTPALSVDTNKNSDYTNEAGYLEDCYLVFEAGQNKSCFCSDSIYYSENLTDCSYCNNSRESCNAVDCINCSNVINSQKLENCHHCLFCYGLKNAQFCIFNRQYTPEMYEKYSREVLSDYRKSQNLFKEMKAWCTQESSMNVGSIGCMWNYINRSSNSYHCFDIADCEDVKHGTQLYQCTDCHDFISFGHNSQLVYEGMGVGTNVNHVIFSSHCYNNLSDLFYCIKSMHGSKNLFWCIGLRNKQYCILNKQYTKEEYETLVPRIIEHIMKTGEWGEFFPPSLSPFGYNETVAMEYYPLTREAIIPPTPLSKGEQNNIPLNKGEAEWNGAGGFIHWPVFNWSDYEAPFPRVEKIIPADKLPDDISKIPDDILNWAIECEVTKKPFRIIKQELEFYRKHNLPIPRRHPDQRHLDRMALRNPRKLFERKCDKCRVEMVTTYSPDREEVVYCEKCYNAEVIW